VLRSLPDEPTWSARPWPHLAAVGLRTSACSRIELLVLERGYFVMERGMLYGIKRRAEGAQVHGAT
jgi:hypothetical protein